jgi:hypothetical protein
MLLIFSTPEFIRHMWQLKTAVFLHWCLINSILLNKFKDNKILFYKICHWFLVTNKLFTGLNIPNKTTHIRQVCRKTIVWSCHRCLINTGVEKMNNILIQIRVLTTKCLQVKGIVGIPTVVYIFKAFFFNGTLHFCIFIDYRGHHRKGVAI